MNKTVKKISSTLHLYLGLASGFVVFIIAITGCLWVFQEEITELIDGDRSVEAQNASFITAEEAKDIAQEIYPDKVIHGTLFGHSTDPVEVVFYQDEPEEFYVSVYLNPYSGEVSDIKDHRVGFFWFILKGHLYLWLPEHIGGHIANWGTVIFVILLFTGIVLWLPKNIRAIKNHITFKWRKNTKWRKKNYDLHSILGFYASGLSFIIAYTGLIMAFGVVAYGTYLALGGEKDPRFIYVPSQNTAVDMDVDVEKPLNQVVPMLMQEYSNYEYIEVHYPETDTSSILVEVSTKEGVYYDTDYLFFDQYTMEELETTSFYGKTADAGTAEKIMRMYYDIHVGAIGGLPGKIIAFFISLITASLPVTGFLFWWGRKKKSKRDYTVRKKPVSKEKEEVLTPA